MLVENFNFESSVNLMTFFKIFSRPVFESFIERLTFFYDSRIVVDCKSYEFIVNICLLYCDAIVNYPSQMSVNTDCDNYAFYVMKFDGHADGHGLLIWASPVITQAIHGSSTTSAYMRFS